jgi:hypothetical protein
MVTQQPGWRTSTYSSNGDDCVEVNGAVVGVTIRHSKDPNGPMISFTGQQWRQWLAELATDAIDNSNGAVQVTVQPDGWLVTAIETGEILQFTTSEVNAFLRGVCDDEFDLRRGEFAAAN